MTRPLFSVFETKSASRPRAHVALSKLTYEPAVAPVGRKGGTRFDQARGFEATGWVSNAAIRIAIFPTRPSSPLHAPQGLAPPPVRPCAQFRRRVDLHQGLVHQTCPAQVFE